MEFISLDEFRSRHQEFDEAVRMTPGIPDYCSGSAWALAAHDTLRPPEHRLIPPLIVHENGHWLLFAQRPAQQGIFYFEPFEGHWLFTCPLVGPNPEFSMDLLKRSVERFSSSRPSCFLIGGVPNSGPLDQTLSHLSGKFSVLQKAEGIPSMWINLHRDFNAFLSSKSRKFRKSIRTAQNLWNSHNISIEEVYGDSDYILSRLMSIEKRSWKFLDNQSIFQESHFLDFYSHMIESACINGDLRFLIASLENIDFAYILGSRFGNTYRGWQMSFDESFRSLSPGNILQLENLKRRAEEGIDIYDLGMFAEYKMRWIDELRKLNIYVTLYSSAGSGRSSAG